MRSRLHLIMDHGERQSVSSMDIQNENNETKATCQKSLLVYITQMITCLIIIIVCVVNLSMHDNKKDLWLTLLSSTIGYILPSPGIKKITVPWKKNWKLCLSQTKKKIASPIFYQSFEQEAMHSGRNWFMFMIEDGWKRMCEYGDGFYVILNRLAVDK